MKFHFSLQYLQQMFTFIKKELKLKVPTYKLYHDKVDPPSLKELAPHEIKNKVNAWSTLLSKEDLA